MKKPAYAEWLTGALTSSGMTQAELGRRMSKQLGRSFDRAAINKMASGGRRMMADEMLAISEITRFPPLDAATLDPPHVSSEDVAAGMGRMDPRQEIDGIPEIDVRAGMGGGGFVDQQVIRNGVTHDPIKTETWSFPATFVRDELRISARSLRMIETRGDSMSPTILPGERVVIDIGHTLPTPDGLYAIRDRYGAIVVKRIQPRRDGRIRILSDNKAHEPEEVGGDEIHIVGRVVCGIKMY